MTTATPQPSSTQSNHQSPFAPRVAQLVRNNPALTTANTNRCTYSPWSAPARSRACSYAGSLAAVRSEAVALPASSFIDIPFTSRDHLDPSVGATAWPRATLHYARSARRLLARRGGGSGWPAPRSHDLGASHGRRT